MFDLKTILSVIGITSLLKEPPIKAICEKYQIGVNISRVDCPPKDEKCFIEKINNNKEVNKDNFITTANWERSVSICMYKYYKSYNLNQNSYFSKRLMCMRQAKIHL